MCPAHSNDRRPVRTSELVPEFVAALVIQSCAESGVPVHITDPQVLEAIVTLLGGPLPTRHDHRRSA